ncbi:response regulator [Desulfobacterales bacterium HSG16]|nr:response regulator [Desulfobacterales bacterium HSG16]
MAHDSEYMEFLPRILIIDDEKRVREGCRKVLTEQGYDVLMAENGEIGIGMIEKEHFDVVLLDLMMPGYSGFEVLNHVKAIHPETVIIVITGYATIEHSIEAMKKGALDFIPKPFSPDQLRVIVAKAIEFTRALQDIATEKTRLRTLINHLTDGVMTTDAQKRVVLANPTFQRIMGYKGKSAIDRPLAELTGNEQLNALIEKTLNSEESKFVEHVEELVILDEAEKKEKIYSAKCLPFRDRLQRIIGSITLLRDITALKQMDQMKSDFVSMVSHEIRSPINSVLAQINVICDGLAGEISDKQKNMLDRSSQKLLALSNMTTELLDLAKIESGLIIMEKESIAMSSLLNEQADFHKAAADEKQIDIHLDLLQPLPNVNANLQNMEEVFSNLITNAIKYSPSGSHITISASIENEYLRVSVKDTGFGIPEEDQPRIFERFYRVKNEKTRMITGTGLGLPIVKNIVESHEGMIQMESTPGSGTAFHVYLPVL